MTASLAYTLFQGEAQMRKAMNIAFMMTFSLALSSIPEAFAAAPLGAATTPLEDSVTGILVMTGCNHFAIQEVVVSASACETPEQLESKLSCQSGLIYTVDGYFSASQGLKEALYSAVGRYVQLTGKVSSSDAYPRIEFDSV